MPADWTSANPCLDPSAASSGDSSFIGGSSPPPSSPFSFSQLSHGIMDRYDLFQNDQTHDFASEVAPSDSISAFSDPEMFPMQMRGFTHHSNYAGDLIFGARTHQPQYQMGSLDGIGLGLGLSGMGQQATAGINPMQLHTPSLPGIDELEMNAICLDDVKDEVMHTMVDVGVQKDEHDGSDASMSLPLDIADISSLINLPPQTIEAIIGMTMNPELVQEMVVTPPATPAPSSRISRDLHHHSAAGQYGPLHSRSTSVPPFEHRAAPQQQQTHLQGHATPQPSSRSLTLFDMSPPTSGAGSSSMQSTIFSPASSMFNESFKSIGDFSDLPFLDMHYHGHPRGSGLQPHDIIDTCVNMPRKGEALDLAYSHPFSGTQASSSTSTSLSHHHLHITDHHSTITTNGASQPYHRKT